VELHEKYPKAQKQGIPWFVLHDSAGAQVADSNGPRGNIGCPNTDEEIEVFLGILKRVCSRLTAQELATLQVSLVAHREKK
jgi:hypothetical protein